MNIYEKLQKARVELQELGLKMGGYNNHVNFKYFELRDFLPEVNSIFDKLKLFSKFDLLENEGVLTIINIEKTDETVTFVTPKPETILKGQNGLQMIGSAHTYLKRYCYLNALEIVDDDIINANIDKDKNNTNQNKKQQAKPKKELPEKEQKAQGIEYINKNSKEFQKEIDKYLSNYSTDSLDNIPVEKLKELCTFIRETKKQKKGA